MAISRTPAQIDKSFKSLVNKEFTTTNRAFNEEFGANTINMSAPEVWTSAISTTPGTSVSNGVAVSYTDFTLTADPAFTTSVLYFMSGSGYTPGTFDRTKIQRNFISDKYGSDYSVVLKNSSGTQIFPGDPINWFFDYQTGILFVENPNTGTHPLPFTLSGYQYIGNTLSGSLANLSGSLSSASGNSIVSGSTYVSASNNNILTVVNGTSSSLSSQTNVEFYTPVTMSAGLKGNLEGTASVAVFALNAANIFPYTGNAAIYGGFTVSGSSANGGNALVTTGNAYLGGDVIVAGGLLVQGNTTSVSASSLVVADQFILMNSGSNIPLDGGLIIQSRAGGIGYGLAYSSINNRWGLQSGSLNVTASIISPDSYLVSVQEGVDNPGGNPIYGISGSTQTAYGNMFVNTVSGDIYIWS